MSNIGEEKKEELSLKDKLLAKRESGAKTLSEEVIAQADAFCQDYKAFLNQSKTEREAVSYAVAAAEQAGFTPYDCKKHYKAGDRVYLNNRGKSVILAVIGKNGTKNGVKLGIAHIDSPRIDLKPTPLYESSDMAFFKTHYYGGIKKYQWMTIPLALHGVVVKKDGSVVPVVVGEKDDEPCFCITDLLPHLADEQVKKPMYQAIAGEDMNVLIGSRPFKKDEESESVKLNIMYLLNEKYGITEDDFFSADLTFVPAHKARDLGFDRSMIGSYGHDDRVCAYPALKAVLDTEMPESTVITVLVDREEIGSDGNTGMKSSFVPDFIADLAEADGEALRHVLAKSSCLSADVNAAYDPTFASAYEASNSTYINRGAVLTKYTGSRGKSGTSEASAEFLGRIRKIFNDNDVLWQTGELGKVDGGGGGTIAKFVANLNVDVVDLGVAVLSMHAPFEVVSKIDVYMLYKGLKAFYA